MNEANPKLAGSNIIDCIPQTGLCPLKCQECYYNGGHFYRTLDEPLIPTQEEAKGKIVRVNSGHDSNLMPEKVLEATEDYEDKFFNTSLPILNFGSPAILTLNGRDTDFSYLHRNQIMGNIDELMAVRFRLNTWNVELCLDAISEWAFHVPFLLTDMRYSDIDNVKKPQHYEFKKHLLNEYWKLNEDGMQIILKLLRLRNVFWCGNPLTKSTMCSECRLCEHFYCKTKIKLESI